MAVAHEMTRTRTLERGVEEWSCTRCSRRLRLRRPPAFEKIVLDPGDEWAAHVGGTGGVEAGTVAASPAGQLGLLCGDHLVTTANSWRGRRASAS